MNMNEPIYCNRYALSKMNSAFSKRNQNRCQSMPSAEESNVMDPRDMEAAEFMHPAMMERRPHKKEKMGNSLDLFLAKFNRFFLFSPVPTVTARIMSPMGFAVHRQAKHLAQVMETSLNDEDWEDFRTGNLPPSVLRPVPIWLCVFLVVSYILGGAYLFAKWENWSFLDSAYFCFITLTTIGEIL